MSDKCEYCKKDLTLLNAENKSRHNLKHLNSGHTKITSIKPITGYIRFFFDQLQFVFENKNFHTQRCSKNSYKFTANELSNEINRDCYNLQYNTQFTSIFDSIKNDNNKHLNRKYLNFNLFVERLESKDEKIYLLKLENLRKAFQLLCYKSN
jgi:hypothetical protein